MNWASLYPRARKSEPQVILGRERNNISQICWEQMRAGVLDQLVGGVGDERFVNIRFFSSWNCKSTVV